MFFALLCGLALAAMGVSYIMALPLMISVLGLRAAYEILVPKGLITRGPSPYQRYVALLAEKGSLPNAPWKGFAVQLIGFGSLIGSITFGLYQIFV